MLVYFDPMSGRITHTVDGAPTPPPPGDHIAVPDGTDVFPLHSFAVQNGALVEVDITPAIDSAISEINAAIGRARLEYITAIPGQDMIYADKELEARLYLEADPEPSDLTEYPFISREVGSTAPTAAGVAQIIVGKAALWRDVGSQMEGMRQEYAGRVRACTSTADIRAEIAAFRSALSSV